MEVKVIGQMDNTIDNTFESANRVYDVRGVAPTINTCGGGGLQPKILEANSIRMVRTPGIELEQTLEVNGNGTSNCLTSVQKDNLVLEKPVLLGGVGEENEFGTQYRQGNRVYSSNAVAMCLNSQPVGNTGGNSYLYNVNYRIRKLTPRECWRLMDFSDEDFEKATQVNSNTQLYRQAGNSICKNVLIAIFGQMLEGREDAYRKL